MKIEVRNLSFGYTGRRRAENYAERRVFSALNADLDGGEAGRPLVILGPSGCGKTTLLKLLGGLLAPGQGRIIYRADPGECLNEEAGQRPPNCAFIFQEPRLLPWLTVLENVGLPLEKEMGKADARDRAQSFLSMVYLEEKLNAYPAELSGGQAQRVSMARAFAWPAPLLFMDEPFQSLDVPLRLGLMDLCLSMLKKGNSPENNAICNNRLLVAVSHDPREAIYMAGRIIILGEGQIVFDRNIELCSEDRAYGSAPAGKLEKELIGILQEQNGSSRYANKTSSA